MPLMLFVCNAIECMDAWTNGWVDVYARVRWVQCWWVSIYFWATNVGSLVLHRENTYFMSSPLVSGNTYLMSPPLVREIRIWRHFRWSGKYVFDVTSVGQGNTYLMSPPVVSVHHQWPYKLSERRGKISLRVQALFFLVHILVAAKALPITQQVSRIFKWWLIGYIHLDV